MAKPVLHQLEISPFCDKVRRVLHVKGIDYEMANVPMAKLSSVKKLSPMGKLPVLEIDGEAIADSSDICRELEQRFPTPALLPADPTQRALVNILEDWADESLYFFEMTMRFTWTHDRPRWVAEILRYDNPIMSKLLAPVVPMLTRKAGTAQGLARRTEADILNELRRHIESLAALVSGKDYLVGDTLSLADISVLAQVECIAGSGKGLDILQQQPDLMAWIERIESQTGGAAIR